jgi:mono/diheme cytochrome c family protein
MIRVKLFLVLSMSALFWVACNGSSDKPGPTANTNSAAPPAAASPAPSSPPAPAAPAPATQAASNANEAAKPAADDRKKDAAREPSTPIVASAIYVAQKCDGCHGADGKGNPKMKGVPDFTDAAWQKKEADAALIAGIKKGKKPLMPPFEGKLSEAEIKALVAYVRSFAK